jgi:hypothetical protein
MEEQGQLIYSQEQGDAVQHTVLTKVYTNPWQQDDHQSRVQTGTSSRHRHYPASPPLYGFIAAEEELGENMSSSSSSRKKKKQKKRKKPKEEEPPAAGGGVPEKTVGNTGLTPFELGVAAFGFAIAIAGLIINLIDLWYQLQNNQDTQTILKELRELLECACNN